jgi:hypothetical protein
VIISKSNNSPQSSQNVGGLLKASLKVDSICILSEDIFDKKIFNDKN